MDLIERTFKIQERGSTVGREILGGVTTFMTLSYIIFVQPAMMHEAHVPMAAAFVGTCMASAIACILMALTANYPIALAPAMGHNAYFTYAVVLGMGFSWQQGLTAVFIGGCVFVLLSFFGFRARLMEFIPDSLKRGIAGGIGLLITFIGLQYAGLVVGSRATGIRFGDIQDPRTLAAVFGLAVTVVLMAAEVRGAVLWGILATTVAGLAATLLGEPVLDLSLKSYATLEPQQTFIALDFAPLLGSRAFVLLTASAAACIATALICAASSLRTPLVPHVLGIAALMLAWAALAAVDRQQNAYVFAPGAIVGVKGATTAVFLVAFWLPLTLLLIAVRVRAALVWSALCAIAVGAAVTVLGALDRTGEFFVLDFRGLFSKAGFLTVIVTFLFLDVFDCIGTLIGVSERAGLLDARGRLPRARWALFSDAAATSVGAVMGTSTVSSYVESAAGVQAGARTGLANLATALLLLLSLLLYPVLAIIATRHSYARDGFLMSQYPVLAPALIVVGSMMLKSLASLNWDDATEFLPAFLTVVLMPMALSITDGIAVGFIAYSVLKLLTSRGGQVHWAFHVVSLALLVRYIAVPPAG